MKKKKIQITKEQVHKEFDRLKDNLWIITYDIGKGEETYEVVFGTEKDIEKMRKRGEGYFIGSMLSTDRAMNVIANFSIKEINKISFVDFLNYYNIEIKESKDES